MINDLQGSTMINTDLHNSCGSYLCEICEICETLLNTLEAIFEALALENGDQTDLWYAIHNQLEQCKRYKLLKPQNMQIPSGYLLHSHGKSTHFIAR